VKIHRSPATVMGDESCNSPLSSNQSKLRMGRHSK